MKPRGHRPSEVLLATDGSIAARWAEVWITQARWAERPKVEVTSMAASATAAAPWLEGAEGPDVRATEEALRRHEEAEAQRIADEVATRLRETDLAVTASTRSGEPGVQLLHVIRDLRPGLVALGSRGRSEVEDMLLGSVVQQVAEHSTAPILVARPAGMAPGSLPTRILVVVDAASRARAALRWLSASGWMRDSRVTLLGLLGPTPGLTLPDQGLRDALASVTGMRARRVLGELAGQIEAAATEISVESRIGHPLEACRTVADAIGADLVALSRPPRPPGGYPFAEKLTRYSTRSVLLVPGG